MQAGQIGLAPKAVVSAGRAWLRRRGGKWTMSTRTRHETVTFQNEFRLHGLEQMQPPGSYVVEVEEELITELSFPAYRRTATVIRLSSSQAGRYEMAIIDPLDLEAALERDAVRNAISPRQSARTIADAGTESWPTAAPGSKSSFFLVSERLRKTTLRLRILDHFRL